MRVLIVQFALVLCMAGAVRAQASRPAQQPDAGSWSDMDERMLFLTAQLASVEASIDAVNKQLKAAGYQQTVKQSDADRARKGNELMDRNMGMPSTIRWEKFYGRTAEKFFYHPTDRNTSYHTQTILTQQPPGADAQPREGVPSRQGLPVQQRPPQIDYIYRANAEVQKRAEADAAKLAGKKDALLDRRRQLEAEQSGLWCKIAFRAVAGRELLGKPLYRFDLKTTEVGDVATERLEALRAALAFLRTANALLGHAENAVDTNQPAFIAQMHQEVVAARKQLDEKLMQQPSLLLDVGSTTTTVGKLSAVAKRMEHISKNMTDSMKLALDGDRAGDDQRKDTFRGWLQDSMVNFAEAVLAGDECVNLLARDWKVVPEVTKVAPTNPVLHDIPKAIEATGIPAEGSPQRPDSSVENGNAEAGKRLEQVNDTLLQPVTSGTKQQPLSDSGGRKGVMSRGARNLLQEYDLRNITEKPDQWTQEGRSLVGGNLKGPGYLKFPALEGDYDLDIRWTRIEGDKIELYLPRGARATAYLSIGHGPRGIGLDGYVLNGKKSRYAGMRKEFAFKNGELLHVVARVRDIRVSISINDVEVVSLEDDSLIEGAERKPLMVGCYHSRCRIESLLLATAAKQ